ncbi:hypothetical protein HDF16_003646 [Granulicella aggregans]|uniref:Uncharacterized protein n=1 Tax=Granulicella aggregans TaxID=474949 RepID=A0A7W8E4C8_9BACT|nr:hypothetical protein [Granulicella aggregans]MBB5058923.1 hypothetical protein [Granulicella aggregans]
MSGKDWRCYVLTGLLVVATLFGRPSRASAEKASLAPAVVAAKSVFLENETGNPAVLETAKKEFGDWGRFSFAQSEDDGDLIVIFSHKFGMDVFGDVSFTVMDVYVRGVTDSPAFEAKNAVKLIWDPQRRTRVCITDFRKRLEKKN